VDSLGQRRPSDPFILHPSLSSFTPSHISTGAALKCSLSSRGQCHKAFTVCVLLTFNSSVTHFGHSIDPVLPTVRLCVCMCVRDLCVYASIRGREVCVCVLGEGLEFSYYFSPALLWAFVAINIPQHAKNVQQCTLCPCVCVHVCSVNE